ncbi:MAG: hypothetical protein Roseis2KO_42600 [Roseivirga sp.]
MKQNRRKKLDKNLALSTFLQAFDRAKIKRKNTDLKTPKAYELLAQKVMESNGLNQADYPNYSNYIKDRFNTIKKLVNNPAKNAISFYTLQFDPIQLYANGTAPFMREKEMLAEVLYTKKTYHFLDFWRMPKPAQLLKTRDGVFIDTPDSGMISIGNIVGIDSFSMPRDKNPCWLQISYKEGEQAKTVYLMPALTNGQPDSILYLHQKLRTSLELPS